MEAGKGKNDKPLRISINYSANTFRVFKGVLDILENPRFLQFWINPETKLLYVRGTNSREKDCLEIPPAHERKKGYHVFFGQRFIKRFSLMAGWSLDKPHMITGTYLEDMHVLVFDLMESSENSRDEDE